MTDKTAQYLQLAWRVITDFVGAVAVSAAIVYAWFAIEICLIFFLPERPLAKIQVSESDGTSLEVYSHWTGAFSGSQHDEYLVYYVRSGGWLGSDQKKLLPSGETAYSGDIVKFRRVNATEIELIRTNKFAGKDTMVIGRYSAGAYRL